ncbi:MAG: hypothetical protein AAGF72_19150 [Pseudomonadota bacterium]
MSNPTIRTFARSSAEFSAELVPDPLLDRLSTGVSVGCLLTGAVLILESRLPAPIAGLAVLAWGLYLVCRLRRPSLRRLRVYANGDVHLQRGDGQWLDGQVAAGSVFLASIAWLRVAGHTPYSGLFVAHDGAVEEWRRFRLIARHFADI